MSAYDNKPHGTRWLNIPGTDIDLLVTNEADLAQAKPVEMTDIVEAVFCTSDRQRVEWLARVIGVTPILEAALRDGQLAEVLAEPFEAEFLRPWLEDDGSPGPLTLDAIREWAAAWLVAESAAPAREAGGQ